MTKSARMAVAAAMLLGGTSLATAQNDQPTGGFREVAGRASNPFRPGKITSRPTQAKPYYGLFDYYAVPPYNPGYAYRNVPAMSRVRINQQH